MAIAMQGLKVKPNYEGLVNVAVSDKLCNVKFQNSDATFLRNGCFKPIRWRRDGGYAITTRTGHENIA